ncbi:MAG: phosphatidylglycerophosphatase A [Sulfurimonas sp.]
MNWFFITFGYSGLSPKAPGTAGSFVALIVGIVFLLYFDAQSLFLLSILTTLIAVKEINKYEQLSGIHDDKRIVIDEAVGMWLALSIAPAISVTPPEVLEWQNGFIIQALLSFAFFRYFDIKKPSLIGRIDREAKGGVGVVFDDVLAGIAGGICAALVWEFVLSPALLYLYLNF